MLVDAAKALVCAVLVFFAFPRGLTAQPVASDVSVEAISHGSVTIRFLVSGVPGATLNWVEYGPTHLLGYRTSKLWTGTTSPRRSVTIGGLKPDARYYFRVVSTSVGGPATATWYCPSADAGPGYECDGPDAPPTFRTGPAPNEVPVSPVLPDISDRPFPQLTGETFQVAIDEDRRCLDLQQQLEAAAAADPEKYHEVVIPAGATCYGEFVLPRKLGTGVVVVRPSTPLELLPPPGVRIDPSFKPLMATLSTPAVWRSVGLLQHTVLATPPAYACEAPCTEGWRFVGLEITHPDHSSIAPRSARITSISEWRSGYTLFKLDQPLPLEHSQSVAIADVDQAPWLNRIWLAIPVSDDSFAVQGAPPDEGASGGYVTQAVSLRVESCGPGPQPVCKTSLPHGLPAPTTRTIASISNATLGTPGISWPQIGTVELSGTPSGADGLWGFYGSSGSLRLVGAVPAGSCSGDCGTATLRYSVQAFAFDDATALNGSRTYTVMSETEVRLDDVEESTAESTGGYLSFDPNPHPRLMDFGRNGRDIVLDRCWIHGRGFPSRMAGAAAFWSDDSAVVDSIISNINSWRPVTSQGGSTDGGANGYYAGTSTALLLGDSVRTEIRNNLFENCLGITIYAEQYRSTGYLTPSDVRISGNTFRNDDAFRAGSATSNGRYHPLRHAIEFKRGQRILIEDNVFDGNWADWTPIGPAIGLLTRAQGEAANNRVQDVTIRNNVFRRVSAGVQILSTDDRIEEPSLPTARVAIQNNLFENVDFYEMRSAPSGVGGLGPSTNYGGQIVYAAGSLEDLSITHNTAIDNRGRGPAFFWYGGGRGSSVQVTDNVFSHNDDSSLGGLPRGENVSTFEGSAGRSPSEAFDYSFTQTPGADPSSLFARNLVLPGVRNSSLEGANDDPAPSRNFTKADCEAFYAGFPEIECAGSGQAGETANQRIASVFPEMSAPRDAGGRGADLEQLAPSAAGIGDPKAVASTGGATIEFRTGPDEACLVDLSETADFEQFQRFESAASDLHSVALDGLTAGQTYYYRVKCTSNTRFGELTIPGQ